MLKTNNKKVKENVKRYIIDSLESNSDLYNPSIKELLAGAVDWYYRGAAYKLDNYKYMTLYRYNTSFSEFLTNHACIFTPYFDDQRELIKEWLEETDQEANIYSDDQVNKLFFNLLNKSLDNLLANNDLWLITNKYDLEYINQFIINY